MSLLDNEEIILTDACEIIEDRKRRDRCFEMFSDALSHIKSMEKKTEYQIVCNSGLYEVIEKYKIYDTGNI